MSLTYKPPKRIQGPRAKANEKARRVTWPAILRRADYRCEMCNGRKQVFWAHVFGRPATGLGLGEWANSYALTAALCADCHDVLDGRRPPTLEDGPRIRRIQRDATDRLEKRLESEGLADQAYLLWTPQEAVREFVRRFEDAGIDP